MHKEGQSSSTKGQPADTGAAAAPSKKKPAKKKSVKKKQHRTTNGAVAVEMVDYSGSEVGYQTAPAVLGGGYQTSGFSDLEVGYQTTLDFDAIAATSGHPRLHVHGSRFVEFPVNGDTPTDRTPLLSAAAHTNGRGRQLENDYMPISVDGSKFNLTGKLKQPPSITEPSFIVAYVIAILAASIYLGPNYFENEDDSVAMMWIHTLASLAYNILVNGYYGESTCTEVPQQVKQIIKYSKEGGYLKAAAEVIDLVSQSGFAFLAAGTYGDMSGTVPWGRNVVGPWVYFILYSFLNKAGLKQLLAKDIYPFMKHQGRLVRQLWASDEFRDSVKTEQFANELTEIMKKLLMQTSRNFKLEHSDSGAGLEDDVLISTIRKARELPPKGLLITSLLATPVLSIVANLGTLGLMNDTTQTKGIFNLLVAYSSITALVGLTLRNAGELATEIVGELYNLLSGVPLIRFGRDVSLCEKTLRLGELAIVGLLLFGGSYFTAVAAVETMKPIGDEHLVSAFWLSIYKVCAVISCMMFNGTPFVGLYLKYRLHALRKKYEVEVDYSRIFDELLGDLSAAQKTDEKLAILSKIETAVTSDEQTRFDSAIDRDAKQVIADDDKLDLQFLADGQSAVAYGRNLSSNPAIMKAMGMKEEALHAALLNFHLNKPADVQQHLSYDVSATSAARQMFNGWFINTIAPMAAFVMAKMMLAEDEADNMALPFIFTFMMLLKMITSMCCSAVDKPSQGFLPTAGKAVCAGLFALSAQEIGGPAAAAAINSSAAEDIGGAVAACVVGSVSMGALY